MMVPAAKEPFIVTTSPRAYAALIVGSAGAPMRECKQNPFHDFTSNGSKNAVLFGSAGLPNFVRTSCGAVK
jgi:hypothetical protein